MDSIRMAAEVREWLEESGILKEMQTRLRAKMIERLMDRNKKSKKGNNSRLNNGSSSPSKSASALNSLILEHLLRARLWYTAAVFTREASDDYGCEDRDETLSTTGTTASI